MMRTGPSPMVEIKKSETCSWFYLLIEERRNAPKLSKKLYDKLYNIVPNEKRYLAALISSYCCRNNLSVDKEGTICLEGFNFQLVPLTRHDQRQLGDYIINFSPLSNL